MLPIRTSVSSYTTKFWQKCRNASTRHGKPKKNPQKNPNAGLNTPRDSNVTSQTWIIEPKVSYWQAKLRAKQPLFFIFGTAGLAAGSIFLTSSSIPPPGKPAEERSVMESISETILFPFKFVFRTLFVDEDVREEARKTWRHKAGYAMGLATVSLYVLSRLVTPRYARYIAILPRRSPTASEATGTPAMMEIYPAFSKHSVKYPVEKSVLVSPLLDKAVGDKLLHTIRILGPPGTLKLTKMGWGLSMLTDGALVNGQPMSHEEVVGLMERIWVQNGGEITLE